MIMRHLVRTILVRNLVQISAKYLLSRPCKDFFSLSFKDWWQNIIFLWKLSGVSHGDRDKGKKNFCLYSHRLSLLFLRFERLSNKRCWLYVSHIDLVKNQKEMSSFVIFYFKYQEERVCSTCQNQDNFDPFDLLWDHNFGYWLYPTKFTTVHCLKIGFSWIEKLIVLTH